MSSSPSPQTVTPDQDSVYWDRVADENPYWGVLSQPEYLGSELDTDALAKFLDSGKQDIGYARDIILRHISPNFDPATAIDFGCGVGRLLVPMAHLAKRVYGVDSSARMLELAGRNLATLGISNAVTSTAIPGVRFDWINSYIVFQHILPRKGIELLTTLVSNLAPGGVISIHLSIFRDQSIGARGISESLFGRFDGASFISYERGKTLDMPIYEYDLNEVMLHLVKAGIESFYMHHTDHGGLHGVWIFGRSRTA